jgi:integrase
MAHPRLARRAHVDAISVDAISIDKLAALHAEDPRRNAKPPNRFNWHALKHFAISCWIDAGLSPKTVQTFAGHSSLTVTMDRYGHLFKSEGHTRAMNAIASEMFKQAFDFVPHARH